MLREGEITPATIQVDRLRCIRQTENPDYSIGTYYDRETSGEDVSRKFVKGDQLVANRALTRPDLEITGRVIKYVEPEITDDGHRGDTVPHFLDNVRIIADMVGFLLLLCISLSVSASAIAKEDSDIGLHTIFTHILAAAISANVIIPSMRMTLLYNVYNVVVGALYRSIKVVNYGCIPKLNSIDRVIFDKTGTLTEECLQVGYYHRYPKNSVEALSEMTGWTTEEVEFALAIANNESNINPTTNQVWGTSPEECEIVNYWKGISPLLNLSNPLRGEGEVRFSLTLASQMRQLEIINREPYRFGQGKLATVRFIGEGGYRNVQLMVRQDGTSHISETVGKDARQWSEMCEEEDPRRSMSLAYTQTQVDREDGEGDGDSDGDGDWCLVGIYSFENPLRHGIPDLIKFVTSQGLPPYILTGDGCEAAEEVSRRAGFPTQCIRLTNNSDIQTILTELGQRGELGQVTLTLEGGHLEDWLRSDPNSASLFLDRNNIPKVIYRASRTVKEQVAKSISNGLYVGDAANDALAIEHSQVGVSLKHGADICRLNADIIMNTPTDLMGLLTKNGYRDMLLAGGERLLEDVCWMGGLTAGCLVVGLHRHGFTFLANSPLYLDTWKPLPMLFVSSLQYTISVLAYASADCESHSHCWRCLATSSARWHIMGLVSGMLIAWCIKNWYPDGNFSYLVLHMLDITVLTKHSWHCWVSSRPRIARRRSGGLFGNQSFGEGDLERRMGFILSILDSVPTRCLLYWVFTLLGEGIF
jgi:hypothetical protein